MTDSHLITSPAINRALLFQNMVTLPRETHSQKNEAGFAFPVDLHHENRRKPEKMTNNLLRK